MNERLLFLFGLVSDSGKDIDIPRRAWCFISYIAAIPSAIFISLLPSLAILHTYRRDSSSRAFNMLLVSDRCLVLLLSFF